MGTPQYKTAYDEFLARSAAGEHASSPGYITASNTLNVSRGDETFLDSAMSVAEDVPAFIGASIISGANQLYNIPASIGNLFGADIELSKTEDVISAVSSDLGSFYTQHKEGVDLAGFVLASTIPGLASIKVLNIGQKALQGAIASGKFGGTLAEGLGLLAPQRVAQIATAVSEVSNSNAVPTLLNAKALHSLAGGFIQNTLESAAFEVGVAATMFNSPILENQSMGDLMTNIVIGAGVGGLLGGSIEAAKLSYGLKHAGNAADAANMPWKFVDKYADISDPYERLVLNFGQLRNIPPIPKQFTPERTALLTQAAKSKVATLENSIRADILGLTKGDQDLTEALFLNFKNTPALEDIEGAFQGLVGTSRLAVEGKGSKLLRTLAKKARAGTASTEELDLYTNMHAATVKIWGSNAGVVTKEAPVVTQLIDTLKPGQQIKVTDAGVTAGSRQYDFSLDYNYKQNTGKRMLPWNIFAADPLEVNARYAWLDNMKPFVLADHRPVYVNEFDIPMLEKVMRDLDGASPFAKMAIVYDDGLIEGPASFKDLVDIIKRNKNVVANRIHNATSQGLVGSDAEVVATKLRSMLGINFNISDKLSSDNTAMQTRIPSKDGTSFRIDVNRTALTTKPLHELVSTILHEEGHSKFDTILDIGGIPTNDFGPLMEEAVRISKLRRPTSWEGAVQGTWYWNYLNEPHELMADMFAYFSQNATKIKVEAPVFDRLYGHIVRPLPQELVDSYAVRARQFTQEEIAAMVNVTPDYLSGVSSFPTPSKDLFAMQGYAEDYTAMAVKNGTRKATDEPVKIWNVPQHARLVYNISKFDGIDNNVVARTLAIKQQQQIYKQGLQRASKIVMGPLYDQLAEINSGRVYDQANRSGSGPTRFMFENGNYGGLSSASAQNGSVTARAIEQRKAATREVLDPILYKLGTNEAAAIKFSTLNANLRNIQEQYGLNAAGDALEPLRKLDWEEQAKKAAAAGERIPKEPVFNIPGTPMSIPVDPEILSITRAHIELNGDRTEGHTILKAAQGVQVRRDPRAFYPIPISPKDFPFFATVTDESITGVGHSKTLYATTEEELQKQVALINKNNPELTVRFKTDAEEYYHSIGQWDYEKVINENYIDSTVQRTGVSGPYFVPTDPGKITADFLNWHLQRDTGLVREAVAANFEVQFRELEALGSVYTKASVSKFSNTALNKFVGDTTPNPYRDFIKVSLAVKKDSDYPWWVRTNTMADEAVSRLFNKVHTAVETATTEDQLVRVNDMLEKAGYKGAAYDADSIIFANAGVQRGTLNRTVAMANSVIATVVLRWDALNAVINAVSSNILLGSEMKAIVRAINRGDKEAVGALAELSRVTVPGTEHTILAPKKAIGNAIIAYGKSTPEELQWFKDRGFVTSISEQYRNTLDELTYTGGDVNAWKGRISKVQEGLRKAADTGERWTGNRLAEEYNRFVAAHTMKQYTDIAVTRGLMSEKEALTYINTFVNRTQGNYLAAQRPMYFQGPIGQAIGLFQTYQFNLMQQLFRHVGEGQAKDALTLLALQGTIYGMNGLPAFNAINTHIVGTASGNTQHKDLYDATYGILGKKAGDWLMYGAASNMLGLIDPALKINLYSRGDINPRHLTILPTNPADVPIYQASVKFFGNLFDTVGKMGKGGDITTVLLQGLEHNGISRPLAGLAQTLEGIANPLHASYSTSSKGNVIAANDMLSLTNLGRIAGAKPLEEAIALDALYRYKAYGLKDAAKRNALGMAIKTTMIAGQNPSREQIESFTKQYVESGGRQKEFNHWFTQLYRTANLSQAQKIKDGLTSPYSMSMQRLMGEEELTDFTP